MEKSNNETPKRRGKAKVVRPMKRKKEKPIDLSNEQEAPVMGVGDLIKKITSFMGIEPCDECERRKEKLNSMFSFLKRTKRDLTSTEVEMIKGIIKTNKVENSGEIFRIYNEVFGLHTQPCQCVGIIKDIVFKLGRVIERQEITQKSIDDENNSSNKE